MSPVFFEHCLVVINIIEEVIEMGVMFPVRLTELAKKFVSYRLFSDNVVIVVRLQRRHQANTFRNVGEGQQLLPFFAEMVIVTNQQISDT